MTSTAGRTEIRRGVYSKNLRWYYRHYAEWGQETGPYETRADAMKALLNDMNFPVEDESAAAKTGGASPSNPSPDHPQENDR